MNAADRKTLNSAARSLESYAGQIHDSETIGVSGHPDFGKFTDDDVRKEYEALIADATALRAIARRKP